MKNTLSISLNIIRFQLAVIQLSSSRSKKRALEGDGFRILRRALVIIITNHSFRNDDNNNLQIRQISSSSLYTLLPCSWSCSRPPLPRSTPPAGTEHINISFSCFANFLERKCARFFKYLQIFR